MSYTTKALVRSEEGLPPEVDGGPDDDRLDWIIEMVDRLIDEWTGWWFESRTRTYLLDGPGDTDTLFFEVPIISITSVERVDAAGVVIHTYDTDAYKVYNRHLSGQLDPDDRRCPRIEYDQSGTYPIGVFDEGRFQSYLGKYVWPWGQKNLKVIGKFGYTDYDGVAADGITPRGIERLARLLILRFVWPAYSHRDKVERADRGRVTDEKTRDQSWKRAFAWSDASMASATGIGMYTGDPEIDSLITLYSKPMGIEMV